MDRLEEEQRPYWRREGEQKQIEEFQDRHRTFADRVERLLVQLVILGLVSLVLVQGLQLNQFIRLAAMEGVPVTEVADWSRSMQDAKGALAVGNAQSPQGEEPLQGAKASPDGQTSAGAHTSSSAQTSSSGQTSSSAQTWAGAQSSAGATQTPAETAGAKVQPVSSATTTMRLRVMSITRRTAPGVRLLVDGESVGDFGTGSVAVEVRHGQVVAIDGSAHPDPLTFRVVEAGGLVAPGLGTSITTRGDSQRLGVVRAAGR